MEPSETSRSYDQLADHWAGDKIPRSNGAAQHQRAIAFLVERVDALDIGCGSNSRLIDLYREHGFATDGIDVSEKMIEAARANGKHATLACADICDWPFPKQYNLISAWDSIWHLPIDRQRIAIGKIARGLKQGGVFIFTTGGVDAPSEHTDSSMGAKLFYGVLGIPGLLKFLNELGLILRHFEYDQFPEKHLYLIVQKPE